MQLKRPFRRIDTQLKARQSLTVTMVGFALLVLILLYLAFRR